VLVAWGGNDHPLPGVRVTLDGLAAGTTDANGLLVVNRSGPAQRFEFEHDSEVWVGGDISPGALSFPSGTRLFQLSFEPRSPR
jgi:hypothetical protein